MVQEILVGLLVIAALLYLGNMIYRNFTAKGKCAGNCNCGIDPLENKI